MGTSELDRLLVKAQAEAVKAAEARGRAAASREIRETLEAVAEALEAIVAPFRARRERYERRGGQPGWFDEMPGDWPTDTITLTMADFRGAEAALARLSIIRENGNG